MITLSIYQKGLLMVFIPFVVNVAWIGLYWLSLKNTDALLEATEKKGQAMFLMSRSVQLFNRTGISLFTFLKTRGNEEAKAKARQQSLDVLITLNELSTYFEDTPNSKAIVGRLSVEFSRIRHVLDTLADKPDLGEADILGLNLPQLFQGLMEDAHSLVGLLDISERSIEHALESQEIEWRQTKLIVVTGLLLNLSIALLLALFFKISVAKRISNVSLAARALTSEHAIPISTSSRDEFSKLELELSDAKMKLSDADNFRRVYMTAVAHRLKNSLDYCVQSSSALAEEKAVVEKHAEKYLQRLNASVSTCMSLIDDVLLLESLDLGNLRLAKEETDLKVLAEEVIELVSNLSLSRNITLENHCEHILLFIDRARLKQVLVNLVANAIKFSAPGSPIVVKNELKNTFVRVSVIDSGPGISKHASAKLFRKFFQTAEGKAAGGTGLGLAISKLIIEAHDGLIGVDSEPGQGSAFWIEIPNRRAT